MSNNNSNSKKTVSCIYGIIVLLSMGAYAVALGQAKTKASKDIDFEKDLLEQFEQDFAVARDQLAYEQYQKRGSEISPWMKDAALPSPDNAALLYCQAFLLLPEQDLATSMLIDNILKGAEPDKRIRVYLGHCQKMLRLTEFATQMPQCTWGIGYGFGAGDLASELRRLNFILAVDARTLAADGHYRAALERCLTIRRLARHLGDDNVLLYSISMSYNSLAHRTIQYVLGVMPQDADLLIWLRGQLVTVQGAPSSFAKILQTDFESILQGMRANTELLGEIRSLIVKKAESEQAKEKAQNLTDEELLVLARKPYARFLDSVLWVIDGDIPYEQKCTEIQRLTEKLKEEYGSDPAAGHVILWSGAQARQIAGWYNVQVRETACFNALKTAIEIYLVKAKTGKLPEELPDYLPKDPYTGKDFEYEITNEGFVLHCKGEDLYQRLWRWLEFKVKK